MHRLSAGDGYLYLMRQVAAVDATGRGHSSLGAYYSAKGESPGTWTGSGLAGLGIDAGSAVSEDQMRYLFGEGRHPNSVAIAKAIYGSPDIRGKGSTVVARLVDEQTKLGRAFAVYTPTERGSEWRTQLREQYEAWNQVRGVPVSWPVPAEERTRIRTDLARRMFGEEFGRAPASVQELTSYLARLSRPSSTAVAGFDLTFTPVKSVSTVWALADRSLAEQMQAIHDDAVTATLTWLEEQAVFTREGPNGVAQVKTQGVIVARFRHRDARSGEPNLHTHCAVSNKVQNLAGKWLALDSRTLYRMGVSASEFYNNKIEELSVARLGLEFQAVSRADGKRTVREIVGVPEALREVFSSRRAAIESRTADLVAGFVAQHERVPSAAEAIKLAQQANLDTRQAKHAPRSEADQRQAWRTAAEQLLGPGGLDRVLADVARGRPARPVRATESRLRDVAELTLASVTDTRASWGYHHVFAETLRQVKAANLPPAQWNELATRVAAQVLAACIPAERSPTGRLGEYAPDELRRSDGAVVFTHAHSQLYTTQSILDAEARIVDAAAQLGRHAASEVDVDLAMLAFTHADPSHPRELNQGQTRLVREAATSVRAFQLAAAPAGTGKTTVMAVAANAHRNAGGTVLGLAPQAGQAEELATAIGTHADTLDKLVYELGDRPARVFELVDRVWLEVPMSEKNAARTAGARWDPKAKRWYAPPGTETALARWADWVTAIDDKTLVIIDEFGRASTPKLDAALTYILSRGGRVIGIGDDGQYAASGAGGVMRDVASTHGVLTLDEVMRFDDPAEGRASLALRSGDVTALGYYLDRGRIHAQPADTALGEVFRLWSEAIAEGKHAIMHADTLDDVAILNSMARAAHLATRSPTAAASREISIGAGREHVAAGDLILTKTNDRRLRLGGTDYVRNGHRWQVLEVHEDGSLLVRQLRPETVAGRVVGERTRRLPADYVASSVRLGYADTRPSVQSRTIGDRGQLNGVSITLLDPDKEDRNTFYTTMTRGTAENHAVFRIPVTTGDEHDIVRPEAVDPAAIAELATTILGRDGTGCSATTALRESVDPYRELGRAADAYLHSIRVAATTMLGEQRLAELAAAAEDAVPGTTHAPAWDTLHAHLALLELDGHDAIQLLATAAGSRELRTAKDKAAVLDWRLDETGNHSQGAGPLQWLPSIPLTLASNDKWSPHLHASGDLVSDLVTELREQVISWTPADAPTWAQPYLSNARLVADLAVWRASHTVPIEDLTPAGSRRPYAIAHIELYDKLVTRAVDHTGQVSDGMNRWADLLASLGIAIGESDRDFVDTPGGERVPEGRERDPQWPLLAARLNLADTLGINVPALLREAASPDHPLGSLPAEHPSSALWWRLSGHLHDPLTTSPAGLAGSNQLRPAWTGELHAALSDTIAERILTDRMWPVIVASIDTATRATGQDPAELVRVAAGLFSGHAGQLRPDELATGLLWSLSTITDPPPEFHDQPEEDPAPEDLHLVLDELRAQDPASRGTGDHDEPDPSDADDDLPPEDLDAVLAEFYNEEPSLDRPSANPSMQPVTALDPTRDHGRAPTGAGVLVLVSAPAAPAPAIDTSPLYAVLADADRFYRHSAAGSWVPGYLQLRGLAQMEAGYAPAGWTRLVDQMRALGHSDQALTDTGLARYSSRGSLIDFYRDRLTLPIHDGQGRVVSFTGRARPGTSDERDRKYINTTNTAIYRKREHPYGLNENAIAQLTSGADLVIAEGATDAAAINAAARSEGLHLVAIAATGTAFGEDDLATLAAIAPLNHRRVLIAFDNDKAGRAAAVKTNRLLERAGLDPDAVLLPAGADPAQLLAEHGTATLAAALTNTVPLLDLAVDDLISRLLPPDISQRSESEQSHYQHSAIHRIAPLLVERSDGITRLPQDIARQRSRVLAQFDQVAAGTLYNATGYAMFGMSWYDDLADTQAASADIELSVDPFADYFDSLTPATIATAETPDAPASAQGHPAPSESTFAEAPERDNGAADVPDPTSQADNPAPESISLAVDSQPQSREHRDEADQPALVAPPSPATSTSAGSDIDDALTGLALDLAGGDDIQQPAAGLAAAQAIEPEAEPQDEIAAPEASEQNWRELVSAINPAVVESPDWAELREALTRAAAVGYDVARHLPQLAAAEGGLDRRWPAYDLLSRLLEDCDAAIEPIHEAPDAVVDVVEQATLESENLARHEPTDPPDTGYDIGAP